MAWISFCALPCRGGGLDSSRLDVVEIARVPDILPRLFPSWSGLRTYQHPGTRISDIMEIRPVRTELFYADRQTDRRSRRHDEADGCFSQFCERAPKMSAWRRLSESCNMQNNSIKLHKLCLAWTFPCFMFIRVIGLEINAGTVQRIAFRLCACDSRLSVGAGWLMKRSFDEC
jgi:hypothetical protein